MNTKKLSKKILEQTKRENGYTHKLSKRYVVGLNKDSVIYELKNEEKIISELEKFLKNNENFGTWIDKNLLYIDYNIQYNNLSEAIERGRLENQLAIWDSVESKEVRLD